MPSPAPAVSAPAASAPASAPAAPPREPAPSLPAPQAAPPEPAPAYEAEDNREDGDPPPPESFPPDWDIFLGEGAPHFAGEPVPAGTPAAQAAPGDAPPLPEGPASGQAPAAAVSLGPPLPGSLAEEPGPRLPLQPAEERPTSLQPLREEIPPRPPFLAPAAPGDEGEGGQIFMLTVVLRSTGDKTRDVLRLRRIHGIITTYPGKDRFAFQVYERGRGHRLEFPNFTAGVCPELLERLSNLLGTDNVQVEPITFL
jgi:DNA polymerase-3 subunit alpha